jgi:hypothetical protein
MRTWLRRWWGRRRLAHYLSWNGHIVRQTDGHCSFCEDAAHLYFIHDCMALCFDCWAEAKTFGWPDTEETTDEN